MTSILFGLAAAFSYGAADFFGGLATRRSTIFSVVVPAQAIGLAMLAAALPFFHAQLSLRAAVMGVLGGLCGGGGIALLYRALAVGKMGVVSPITAVLAAALPVAAGALRGEQLSILQCGGITIALLAVVLISMSTQDGGRFEFSLLGVREAVASGVLLSGFYIFLAFAPHEAGPYSLLFARLASTLMLLAIALLARKAVVPPRIVWTAVIAAGVLDMGANGLYVAAAYSGYVSIAAVLTSLYPAATVLMARLFLHERLGSVQMAGVGLALAGVAMIGS